VLDVASVRRTGAFLAGSCREALDLSSRQWRQGAMHGVPAPGRPGCRFHTLIVAYATDRTVLSEA
jgi:hypothetical protein